MTGQRGPLREELYQSVGSFPCQSKKQPTTDAYQSLRRSLICLVLFFLAAGIVPKEQTSIAVLVRLAGFF